jgi:dTDP-4-dehydrorhamnose 3,5-epimerase
VEVTEIPGVRLVDLVSRGDERGAFMEVYRQAWLPEGAAPIVQSNLSHSRAGVLRGLHHHLQQADYWCVLEGQAFVALVDLREGSPTFRAVAPVAFKAPEELRGLYVPPGVAHGFFAITDVVLLYQVDAYFTGKDEYGVAWNDPELAIAWPVSEPILSERDQQNRSLAEALRDPPRFSG